MQYDIIDVEFDGNPPMYKEFAKKLRKTRSKSALGPNGVPYLVYKSCPGVSKFLWNLRLLWGKNVVSDAWREAEGVFLPKQEGASSFKKFRTIWKLCYLLESRYTDPTTQKGGIPVLGCLEHTALLSQLIREAKT